MASYIPLNRIEHAARQWRRPVGYAFAAEETIIPLAAIEAAQAAAELPLAFASVDGVTQLVAVMSAKPGRNWFVGSDGRWLGQYVPALFRAYPFRLACADPGGQFGLWIANEPSSAVDGEPIYDQAGELTPRVKAMASFLMTFENSRLQTQRACAALESAGVLAPWTIRLRAVDEREEVLEGLLRIDDGALSDLSDDAFVGLRRAGALGIAHAQLLSVSRLDILARLPKVAAMLGVWENNPHPDLGFLRPSDDDVIF